MRRGVGGGGGGLGGGEKIKKGRGGGGGGEGTYCAHRLAHTDQNLDLLFANLLLVGCEEVLSR